MLHLHQASYSILSTHTSCLPCAAFTMQGSACCPLPAGKATGLRLTSVCMWLKSLGNRVILGQPAYSSAFGIACLVLALPSKAVQAALHQQGGQLGCADDLCACGSAHLAEVDR